MKSSHISPLLLISSLLMLSACVSVKDEIFLQNMKIEGSPSQPPVHITSADRKVKSFYASPHVSISSGTVTAALDQQYDRPIPDSLADFKSKGLSWDLPRASFGIDFDYAASNSLALNGGVAASVGQGQQLTSFYGGIGLYSADSPTSFRLDIGVQYSDIRYRGATVIHRTVGSSPQDTIYYLDRGKEFQFNLYANLTINSTNDGGLNWFVQLGINPQTLTDFVPRRDASNNPSPYASSDLRAESSVFWISATPGIYFSLAQDRRVLLGVRFLRELSSESSTPGVVIIPMIQFDWSL